VTIWTCEHTLSTAGQYANQASVEADHEAGKKTSNRVVANAGQAARR
jgi:hypothetical protein